MKKALYIVLLLVFTSALTVPNCLEKYHGNPEELLSVDLVGKFVDFKGAVAEAEKISEQIIKDPNFAQVNCEWRIDGQRYIVRLKQIKKIQLYESKTPVERFYTMYHTRTEEEMEELQELYDKEVTEKVNSEDSEKVITAIGLDYKYLRIEKKLEMLQSGNIR